MNEKREALRLAMEDGNHELIREFHKELVKDILLTDSLLKEVSTKYFSILDIDYYLAHQLMHWKP